MLDIPEKNRAAIRNFMAKEGLKVTSWCKSAGIAEATLRNFLKGSSRTLTVEKLSALADAVNAIVYIKGSVIRMTMDDSISITDQVANDTAHRHTLEEKALINTYRGLSESEQKKYRKLSSVFGEDD